MALTEICAAITNELRSIPGVSQVPDAPPAQLGEDRMLVIYPQPGPSTPASHRGRSGNVVISNRDVIVVEWHLKRAADQTAEFLQLGVPLLDLMRTTLWRAFNPGRFGGTVEGLYSIDTDHFGELGWGSDHTWGFRLMLDLSHSADVGA